jgi:hypothetical protein
MISESSQTVIAVTASDTEDEREPIVTLPQAYYISVPHDTVL